MVFLGGHISTDASLSSSLLLPVQHPYQRDHSSKTLKPFHIAHTIMCQSHKMRSFQKQPSNATEWLSPELSLKTPLRDITRRSDWARIEAALGPRREGAGSAAREGNRRPHSSGDVHGTRSGSTRVLLRAFAVGGAR